MSQPPDQTSVLLESLARNGMRLVAVAAGGGSLALSGLLSTPGSSRVVVECLAPSAREAVDLWLGGVQESYCCSRAARRLATMAWQRSCRLGSPPASALGVAVTCSLRTVLPKRGDHRVVAAVQTLDKTSVATLTLVKDARSRDHEERLAADLLLDRIARHMTASIDAPSLPLLETESVTVDESAASIPWQGLLAGSRHAVAVGNADVPPEAGLLVFPGSFDPLHEGHVRMAVIAQEIAERPLDFELSITNVDKPALDYVEMRDRVAQFADRRLWLTRAATFVEKLRVFPEGTFVMGADTFARLADPRYYDGSNEAANRAVEAIVTQSRGLIVFGRERQGVFEDPSQFDVPRRLREAAYFVSPREFRLDISSTALRRRRTPLE